MTRKLQESQLTRYDLALAVGQEALRQKKWKQALICFQAAAGTVKGDARVYDGLGDSHLGLGDPKRALACYEEAARLAPGVTTYPEKVARAQEKLEQRRAAARTFVHVGDIFWRRDEAEAAAERWQFAVDLWPDLAGAHERLAMVYRQWAEMGRAVDHYRALAGILTRDGRCLTALHVCYTALDLAPDDDDVWAATERAWHCVASRDQYGTGHVAKVQSGDLVNAAAEFAQWQLTAEFRRLSEKQLESDDLQSLIFLRQAMLHEGYGRAGQAIAFYEKAIGMGFSLPAVFFAIALLYRLVGRRAEARAAFLVAGQHVFYRRAAELLAE